MLANSTVLLIRHAEKPDKGRGLSPMGTARAEGYAAYFPSLPLHPKGHYDHLYASEDSEKSHRPKLTLTPLAHALGDMHIETPYLDKDYCCLAEDLLEPSSHHSNENILVCWHHGEILALANLLLKKQPPPGWPTTWPGGVFGWLLWISYDANENPTSATTVYM
jgi:phosphohistidine phosphatase SixA